MKRVAVIGAGITRVTSAYALARRGDAAAVIDRHRYPAMKPRSPVAGSFSNASPSARSK